MTTLSAVPIGTEEVSPAVSAIPRRSPFARLTLVQKFALLSFMCVLGICVAVSAVWNGFLRAHFMSHDAAIAGELVDLLLTQTLPASYAEHGHEGDAIVYEKLFAGLVGSAGIVRVMVYDVTGRIVWSDAHAMIGARNDSPKLRGALKGRIEASVVHTQDEDHRIGLTAYDRVEEIYLPVRYERDGPVVAVLEIYRQAPFDLLDRLLTIGWIVGGGGALVLYLTLFAIVRQSSRTQGRLEEELTAHARSLEERVRERTTELVAKTREASQLYEDMKATKEYLENLIASSVDGIVTVGAGGLVTFASRGAQRILSDGDTELSGTPIARYWTTGPRELHRFRKRLAATGRVENHETELRAVDGRTVHVNMSASLLRGAAGEITGVLAVIKDVTDLKKMQVQMMRGERLAAAGLLAAGVAHEVGNPLTCISSLAQVLCARTRDAELGRGLQDIEVHAGRIERILQGLTQLTRPGPLPFEDCSIEPIVRSAMHLARHNPAARRMDITATFDPELPTLRVAPDQLLQVFLNLILNAADAGGVLAIDATPTDDAVRIAFRDTGWGISRDQLRRLFDPFYSTKESGQHMGLGLFVSLEIVRLHGGTIVADSELGSGSTFTVILPAER